MYLQKKEVYQLKASEAAAFLFQPKIKNKKLITANNLLNAKIN